MDLSEIIDTALEKSDKCLEKSNNENELENLKYTLIMLLFSEFENKKDDSLYEDAMELMNNLKEKEKSQDVSTDTILKTFSDTEPFSLIIPEIRYLLGFGIHSDEQCASTLRELKNELKGKKEEKYFDSWINFVESTDAVDVPDTLFNIYNVMKALNNYQSKSKLLECSEYMRNLIDNDESS